MYSLYAIIIAKIFIIYIFFNMSGWKKHSRQKDFFMICYSQIEQWQTSLIAIIIYPYKGWHNSLYKTEYTFLEQTN